MFDDAAVCQSDLFYSSAAYFGWPGRSNINEQHNLDQQTAFPGLAGGLFVFTDMVFNHLVQKHDHIVDYDICLLHLLKMTSRCIAFLSILQNDVSNEVISIKSIPPLKQAMS